MSLSIPEGKFKAFFGRSEGQASIEAKGRERYTLKVTTKDPLTDKPLAFDFLLDNMTCSCPQNSKTPKRWAESTVVVSFKEDDQILSLALRGDQGVAQQDQISIWLASRLI